MVDVESRKETMAMIDELCLTIDDLIKMTKYTKEHIERYMNFKSVASKTECKIWFVVNRLYKEVK
nr:MAG TPA: hypothetical protein [Caudoviricetes sp.]